MTRLLSWPLEAGPDGRLRTVAQDSPEHIEQCVAAIGRTRPGDRWDAPAMGVEPLEFRERPLDLTQLRSTLARHEPRVSVTVLEDDPRLQTVVEQVAADITLQLPDAPHDDESDA